MSHAAWNERVLSRPVLNIERTVCPKLDLFALRELLAQAVHRTFEPTLFNEAAALASRLIARRASSFRSQVGFKRMRQCNIALCRLHECNVHSALEDLLATLPAVRSANGAYELPTRDYLDWVLVRVRSLAQQLLRIVRLAREASELFVFYVHRGFFLETSLVHVAVLADVWHLAFGLCEQTVDFYDRLRPLAEHFGAQQRWLRSVVGPAAESLADVLPASLAPALGAEWSEEVRRARSGAAEALRPLPDAAADVVSMYGFTADDDGEAVLDVQPLEEEGAAAGDGRPKAPPAKRAKLAAPKATISICVAAPQRQSLQQPTVQLDIGEAVARPAATSAPTAAATAADTTTGGGVAAGRPALRLEQLVSVDDVQAFMKTERVRLTQCAVGAIGEPRWKELQAKCNHILVTTQGRRTVQEFRSFWLKQVMGGNGSKRVDRGWVKNKGR